MRQVIDFIMHIQCAFKHLMARAIFKKSLYSCVHIIFIYSYHILKLFSDNLQILDICETGPGSRLFYCILLDIK